MEAKIFRDPVKETYVISAPSREKRPFQEDVPCPFCNGSEEIIHEFSNVRSLPNKYPALVPNAPEPKIGLSPKGYCEVILYSSNHNELLFEKPLDFINELVNHWTFRSDYLARNQDFVKYIFPFETFGKEIGVSLSHPHGQLFALPFIPPVVKTKQRHLQKNDCLFCDLDNNFIPIFSCLSFQIVFPIHARWPIELYILPNFHVNNLIELSIDQKSDLAKCLKKSLESLYLLYGKPIPYMMSVFQGPVNTYDDFHLHIELLSPQITESKLKYRAALETSLDVFINSINPQEIATKLKRLMEK